MLWMMGSGYACWFLFVLTSIQMVTNSNVVISFLYLLFETWLGFLVWICSLVKLEMYCCSINGIFGINEPYFSFIDTIFGFKLFCNTFLFLYICINFPFLLVFCVDSKNCDSEFCLEWFRIKKRRVCVFWKYWTSELEKRCLGCSFGYFDGFDLGIHCHALQFILFVCSLDSNCSNSMDCGDYYSKLFARKIWNSSSKYYFFFFFQQKFRFCLSEDMGRIWNEAQKRIRIWKKIIKKKKNNDYYYY